ncbi:MAG: hypothetical protein ACKO0Z_01385 [Betaproteobacteria bacterium]
MNTPRKFAARLIATVGFGLLMVSAHAQNGPSPSAAPTPTASQPQCHGKGHGDMGHGMGMGRGMGQGMGSGTQGEGGKKAQACGSERHAAIRELMTEPERQAMKEKMRAAKSPEERKQLMAANRAEMEKRAKEKGITLPAPRSGQHSHGSNQSG